MRNTKDYIKILGLKLSGLISLRPLTQIYTTIINNEHYYMLYALNLGTIEPIVVLEKESDAFYLLHIINHDKRVSVSSKLSNDAKNGKVWSIDPITNRCHESYSYPLEQKNIDEYVDFLQNEMNLRRYTISYYAESIIKEYYNSISVDNDWEKITRKKRDDGLRDIFG